MITLEPFIEDDFDRLIVWISTEEDLIQFASPYFSFLLTKDQLQKYLLANDRKPMKVVMAQSGEVIEHCELNYSSKISRLSRILIGKKEYRNKGYGKIIVNNMLDLFLKSSNVNLVELIVWDWNLNAISCYKKVGFYEREAWEDIVMVNKKAESHFYVVGQNIVE